MRYSKKMHNTLKKWRFSKFRIVKPDHISHLKLTSEFFYCSVFNFYVLFQLKRIGIYFHFASISLSF